MKKQEVETVMTYNQWTKLYKRRLKKHIRCKIKYYIQWFLFGLFMVAIPVGMIAHWLLFGY